MFMVYVPNCPFMGLSEYPHSIIMFYIYFWRFIMNIDGVFKIVPEAKSAYKWSANVCF
jgi:hypothetical protein